jgi:molybdate-binding protein/DNA-binding XRE family transcriptional regulator
LTQSQLAEWAGVRRQAIYDIESGRYLPNTALALRLARHLGCKVEDLFSERSSEEMQPVTVSDKPKEDSPRVAVAKVRGRLVAYPLAGKHALNDGFQAAQGLLEPNGTKVRLLCSEEVPDKSVFLLGCDPAFAILREHVLRNAPEVRIHCRFASSHRALELLAAGHAHLAGTHLHNSGTMESNVRLAKRMLLGSKALLVGFSRVEEGLMVAPNNPFAIRTTSDLAQPGVRLVNREPGAALRTLLDDYLDRAGVAPQNITGYANLVTSHLEGAQMVADHSADAALGLRAVAASFGLGFVPLEAARCDLVIPCDLMDHLAIRIILDTLHTGRLREELASLPGYDSSHTGEVIAEV